MSNESEEVTKKLVGKKQPRRKFASVSGWISKIQPANQDVETESDSPNVSPDSQLQGESSSIQPVRSERWTSEELMKADARQ